MSEKLKVNIVWHLHQPYYRAAGDKLFMLPWVRLHTLKEYHDMAEMVERHPKTAVTFNWSPALLKQVEEYVDGRKDEMQKLREKAASDLTPEERYQLVRGSFRANPATMIKPYPALAKLHDRWEAERRERAAGQELHWNDQVIRDCQVWGTLIWFGFSALKKYPEIDELRKKAEGFTPEDKIKLKEIEQKLLAELLPRWKNICHKTAAEISVNPYFHPIAPLLCNYSDIEEAMPDVPQPERSINWPGDVRWHLQEAKNAAQKYFDIDSVGLWPSEGSVSESFMNLVDECGFRWVATDEALLHRAFGQKTNKFQAYSWKNRLPVFFRDTKLSDLIGFDYSRLESSDAVNDFFKRLEQIKNTTEPRPERLLTVILDGENPWEHFYGGGENFLDQLYSRFKKSDQFQTITPNKYLQEGHNLTSFDRMGAGSWINGDFNIWGGSSEDVRAWELLAETREALYSWENLDAEQANDCWRALYAAQGSDWFWWYGEPFHSEDDEKFDRLFRENLIYIYKRGGHPEPSYLHYPLHSTESPGYEPPRNFISPEIEGRETHYWEWWGAAKIITSSSTGSMARSTDRIKTIRCGSDEDYIYFYVSFSQRPEDEALCRLAVNGSCFELGPLKNNSGKLAFTDSQQTVEESAWAYGQILECKIPLSETKLKPGDYCNFQLIFRKDNTIFERFPVREKLAIPLLDKKTEASEWTA